MTACSATGEFIRANPESKKRFINSGHYAKNAIQEAFKIEMGDFQPASIVRPNIKSQKNQTIDWNQVFLNLRDFPQPLRFERSEIHRWGVFAKGSFAAGEPIIEYKGSIITQPEAHTIMTRCRPDDLRLLHLKNGTWIDSSESKSLSKYINHSCSPNCEVMLVQDRRVLIYAKRDIAPNEEITIKYEPGNRQQITCNCGSANCCGFVGSIDAASGKRTKNKKRNEEPDKLAPMRTFLSDAQILIPGNKKVTEWLMDMLALEKEKERPAKPKPEPATRKQAEITIEQTDVEETEKEYEEEASEEIVPKWHVHHRKIRDSDYLTEVFEANLYDTDVLVWGGGMVYPKDISQSATSDDEE